MVTWRFATEVLQGLCDELHRLGDVRQCERTERIRKWRGRRLQVDRPRRHMDSQVSDRRHLFRRLFVVRGHGQLGEFRHGECLQQWINEVVHLDERRDIVDGEHVVLLHGEAHLRLE